MHSFYLRQCRSNKQFKKSIILIYLTITVFIFFTSGFIVSLKDFRHYSKNKTCFFFVLERNKKYLELEKFLLDVTFLCEIFHHIRIEGKCLKVLSRPVNDYFTMLIDGASQKEVEVFFEQVCDLIFVTLLILM